MTENDRPLPAPPRSRFGRDSQEDAGPASSMISDRMALAAAEGRLEEFLQQEIPEGDHARNLAMMMMGMSGMMPQVMPAGAPRPVAPQGPAPAAPAAQAGPSPEVPPAVLAAVEQGNVANLMSILRAEHAKRTATDNTPQTSPPESPALTPVPSPVPPKARTSAPTAEGRAGIDTAIIDELIRISADNDVSVDWLMLRAIRLYVEEYRKTGRL